MYPMRCREIIEGKEHILVFLQASNSMGILAAVHLYEVIVRFQSSISALGAIHLMDMGLGFRLHALRELV